MGKRTLARRGELVLSWLVRRPARSEKQVDTQRLLRWRLGQESPRLVVAGESLRGWPRGCQCHSRQASRPWHRASRSRRAPRHGRAQGCRRRARTARRADPVAGGLFVLRVWYAAAHIYAQPGKLRARRGFLFFCEPKKTPQKKKKKKKK